MVDTGIHALGWSRKKAVRYLLENTNYSKRFLRSEVNRYINMPGQACTYKIGEMKIMELREKATEQLGSKFDLRQFHSAVLKCLGPLSALETCIERFVERLRH